MVLWIGLRGIVSRVGRIGAGEEIRSAEHFTVVVGERFDLEVVLLSEIARVPCQ